MADELNTAVLPAEEEIPEEEIVDEEPEEEEVSLSDLGLEEEKTEEEAKTEPPEEPDRTVDIVSMQEEIARLEQKIAQITTATPTSTSSEQAPPSREQRVSSMFYEEMAAQGYDAQTAWQMSQENDQTAMATLRATQREITRQIEHEEMQARMADMQSALAETVNMPRVTSNVKSMLGDGTSDEMAGAVASRLVVHFPEIKQNPNLLNTIPEADRNNLLEDMQYAVIGRRAAAAARKSVPAATTDVTIPAGTAPREDSPTTVKLPSQLAQAVRDMRAAGVAENDIKDVVNEYIASIKQNGGA